jgi:predicted RNA-binding Zn-ribbon protein involved in translation (DUF1610 family)
MAEITLIPINSDEADGMTVVDTGVAMLGMGGNSWRCGHCGRMVARDIDLAAVQVPTAYQCSMCGGLSVVPKG